MATATVSKEHVEISPGVCGGRPRIAGTRIKVQLIAICHEQMGLSPAEILASYPHLTMADIHAALAYFYDHREVILEHIRQDEELVASVMGDQPSLLEKVQARLAALQADPVPPGRELHDGPGPCQAYELRGRSTDDSPHGH